MKVLSILLPLFMMSFSLTAQSDYAPEQEGWFVDLNEAYQESQKTGKPIMANFTGSDWCGWCKRLSAAVFNKPEFKSWAAENVVLLELDFPRRKSVPADIKKQNSDLQRAFQVRGFPTVWVFDLDKDEQDKFSINAYGKTGYKATVQEFTSSVEGMIATANKGS